MSLWDGFDGVASHDTLPYRASNTGPTNLQNNAAQPFLKTKDAQLLVNDGSNDRVVIGQRTDGTFGIKVSKTGSSATTSPNSSMIMNSDFNQFKIVGSGTATMTVAYVSPGASPNPYIAGFTVAHNLGFVPAFLAFVTPPVSLGFSGYFPVPWTVVFWNNTAGQLYPAIKLDASSDTVNFYGSINTDRGSFDGAWVIKYYLLQETAN